jgi:surface antigen
MRDHRTLVVLCLMFGAMALAPVAAAQTASSQASATQPAVARPAAAQAPAPRARPIPPQQQAQAALLTPVAARAPLPGPGTPILPVAQTAGLSCVPYVRMATGMNVSGDARMWWHNAAATYARGQTPERGSVLAFMSSGGMARGHVAVVSRVLNPRTIEIDHANWAGPGIRRGAVMRGVTVVDVSDRNDWTSVRVQVGHNVDNFGRTYPTHGFIYNRPAGPRTLMAAGEATREVAEAPMPHAALHLRFALEALAE